ncbi:MAG: outer membrane beta-barrel protein [Gemmatimonadaceae bacterium]|nr:outer membrane beta-barrel protein [Gemmatimonadaceae bacterium]
MKISMKVFGMLGLLASPFAMQAQTTRTLSLGVSGGLSLPMGNLGDNADAGYNVTGHVYFKPSTMKFALRGDVGYDSWKSKSSNSVVSADVSSLSFTGNGIFYLGESTAAMRPYLLVGGGMYRTKSSASVSGVSASSTSTDPGIQGGLGMSFNLNGFNTFLEAKYVNVFGDGDSMNYVPITFGIRF